MLSRGDFVFTIGYDGPTAVVDNQAKRKYGKLSTRELAEKGLFRAAYSSAVFSNDVRERIYVGEVYRKLGKLSAAAQTAGSDQPVEDLPKAELPKTEPQQDELPETKLSEAQVSEAGLSEAQLSEADLLALDRLFGVILVDVNRSISL